MIWVDMEGYKYFKKTGKYKKPADVHTIAVKYISNATMDKIIEFSSEGNDQITYYTEIHVEDKNGP